MAELSRRQRHKVRLALPGTKLPLLLFFLSFFSSFAFEDLRDLQEEEKGPNVALIMLR